MYVQWALKFAQKFSVRVIPKETISSDKQTTDDVDALKGHNLYMTYIRLK